MNQVPLEVRPGLVPPVKDWKTVSEIHVWGRLDMDGQQLVHEALTNPVNPVKIVSMDEEARRSLDPSSE